MDSQLLLLGAPAPPDPPREFKLGGSRPPRPPRDTGGSAPRPPTVKFGGSAVEISRVGSQTAPKMAIRDYKSCCTIFYESPLLLRQLKALIGQLKMLICQCKILNAQVIPVPSSFLRTFWIAKFRRNFRPKIRRKLRAKLLKAFFSIFGAGA